MSDMLVNKKTSVRLAEQASSVIEKGIGDDKEFYVTDERLKKQTHAIADNYNLAFYIGGAFQMNRYCHIHEDYSLQKYNELKDDLSDF